MTTDELISKIVTERDFDVPYWVYERLNMYSIQYILKEIRDLYTDIALGYKDNKNLAIFLDTIRNSSTIQAKLLKDKPYFNYSEAFFLFNHINIAKLYGKSKMDYTNALLISVVLMNDVTCDTFTKVVQYLSLNKKKILIASLDYIDTIIELNTDSDKSYNTYNDKLCRLFKIVKPWEHYKLCEILTDRGIPVLYKHADDVDAALYIDLYTKHRVGKFNENVKNFNLLKNSIDQLVDIATFHDVNAYKGLKGIISDNQYKLDAVKIIMKKVPSRIELTDFDDVVEMVGGNSFGLPIEIQRKFINDGGNVLTMIDDNGYPKPEASIIKDMYELPYLIKMISNEELAELLKTPNNIFQNILISDNLTYPCITKLLKSIVTDPVDKDLWNSMNKEEMTSNNHKVHIIKKYYSMLGNTLFNLVPEAMMYLNPSMLYLSRNMDKNTIKYASINKILPYLVNQYIKSSPYIKLNRFCNGEYVSISTIFGDLAKTINFIVDNRKFGYIGDIEGIGQERLIETIVRRLSKKEIDIDGNF